MASEPDTARQAKRLPVGGLLRIAGSLIVFLIIFQFIPVGEVWTHMKAISLLVWFAVFAAFFVGHALAAAKWRWIVGGNYSYLQMLKAHFAGLAANLALPGVAGGDIVRAGMLMKASDNRTGLAIGSLIDRLVDISMLVILSAIGGLWLGAKAGLDPTGLVIVASIIAVAGFGALVYLRLIARLMLKIAPGGKIGGLLVKISSALEDMSSRRGLLLFCALLSLAIQAGFALLTATLAWNLGVDASAAAWLFAWPLAKLVATLPISLGGLGVREASLSGLMAPLGIASAGIIAAGLVWQTILYAAGAVGALVQLVWRPQTTGVTHG